MSTHDEREIAAHCAEIERCNQRGGRMLSITDLLDAGTFTPDLAAHCIAAVASGTSFLVGAVPGGAGKTTVMGALLNFVPPDLRLQAATPQAVMRAGNVRRCWVCHEIGPGPYYAYLWGAPLRAWFALARGDSMLASNLHADTIEEVEYQTVGENTVPEEDLRRVRLILFMKVRRGFHHTVREVTEVYESDGSVPHTLYWSRSGGHLGHSSVVTAERCRWAAELVDRLNRERAVTIQQVRAVFIQEWQRFPGRGG